MKRLLVLLLLLSAAAVQAAPPSLLLPKFPLPALVRNGYGETRTVGFLHFLHELQDGGVQSLEDVDLIDQNYAMIQSGSLATLAAWLDAACRCVGVDLPQARHGEYDGMAYAQLLAVATSLGAVEEKIDHIAMPIGVVICMRHHAWGDLPGDGARDAYLLIATERGLLVYDPPTRQLTPLGDFPNHEAVFKVQF